MSEEKSVKSRVQQEELASQVEQISKAEGVSEQVAAEAIARERQGKRHDLKSVKTVLEGSGHILKGGFEEEPADPNVPVKITYKIDGVEITKYLIEGDIPVSDLTKYEKESKAKQQLSNLSKTLGVTAGLVADSDDEGNLIRWAPEQARNLSWWVDERTFEGSGIRVKDVIAKMGFATADWEAVCGVKFRQVDSKAKALFTVRYTFIDNNSTIAMAFFPNAEPKDRLVHIFPGFKRQDLNSTGVLRHELGHVLGFRHEHIRLGNRLPRKFREDVSHIVPLTEYDQDSVMHYDFRTLGIGTKGTNLEITSLDAYGAQLFYGGSLSLFASYGSSLILY